MRNEPLPEVAEYTPFTPIYVLKHVWRNGKRMIEKYEGVVKYPKNKSVLVRYLDTEGCWHVLDAKTNRLEKR